MMFTGVVFSFLLFLLFVSDFEISCDCEPCEAKFRVQALLHDPASCYLRRIASVCIFAIVAATVKCADASCLIAAVSSLTGSSMVDIVPTAW